LLTAEWPLGSSLPSTAGLFCRGLLTEVTPSPPPSCLPLLGSSLPAPDAPEGLTLEEDPLPDDAAGLLLGLMGLKPEGRLEIPEGLRVSGLLLLFVLIANGLSLKFSPNPSGLLLFSLDPDGLLFEFPLNPDSPLLEFPPNPAGLLLEFPPNPVGLLLEFPPNPVGLLLEFPLKADGLSLLLPPNPEGLMFELPPSPAGLLLFSSESDGLFIALALIPFCLVLANPLPDGLLFDGLEDPKDEEGLEEGPVPDGLTPLGAPLNLAAVLTPRPVSDAGPGLTPGPGLMSSCCLPPLPSWPNPRPGSEEAGPVPPKLFPLPAPPLTPGRELPCLPSSLPSEPKFTKDCRFCFLLPPLGL